MKKIFTLLLISIFTITIWAQSPNKLSYQAVVRDADNNLISEQAVGMQISILQSSATGTAVYTETHTPTTNANGLVTVEIGGGATADDFSTIDWAAGPYFIKTEIDPDGSTNYTITAVSQLLTVPYAKYADEAGNVFSGSFNDLTDVPADLDTDATDDFSGSYNDLTDVPADLVVEGTAKFGSNGIVISELREITGTTHAVNNYTKITLPDGYTAANTRVLSVEIDYLSGDNWKGIGSDNINSDKNNLSYGVSDTFLYIYYYNDVNHFLNRTYRVLLMKVAE